MVKEETVKKCTARTKKSKKLWEEAREVIPGGIGSAVRYFKPYPFFISKARGSKVWDVDGNEYVNTSKDSCARIESSFRMQHF